MNDWKPIRAANRCMPLIEAYICIEDKRDRLILFMTSNALLTQWEKSKINEEVSRMSVWLANHKIKVSEDEQTIA